MWTLDPVLGLNCRRNGWVFVMENGDRLEKEQMHFFLGEEMKGQKVGLVY
jgi:hypothetical protein